jgi:DNA-binding transcriptional MerR regulator
VPGAPRDQAKPADLVQIGEVAERAGLSLRTVRYYEEMGLVSPETRTEGGFRLYTDAQVDRLLLIKRMKPLGFTVQEMRELLDAREALRDEAADDRALADARELLGEYTRAAAERCEKLRIQVESADELVRQLKRESRPPRRPSARA